MSDTDIKVDINKFSRQIAVYGYETQSKYSNMNIFIYGMRGVGIETAKNAILAGPRKLTIFDNNISRINDLTANYFISENDVKEGKRRDESSIYNLSKLNPTIKLEIMENVSIIEHLEKTMNNEKEKYNIVIITEFMEKNFIIQLNNFCRENKIGFIYGCELGINVFCFSDFGDDFEILDIDGEEYKRYSINSISKEIKGIVNLVHPIDKSEIKNDDYVIFKEIQGMKELNKCPPIKIKIIDEYNIQINDTSKFSNYICGGVMIKAKMSLKMKYKSFEKKLEEPYNNEDEMPLIIDDTSSSEIIHTGILSLYLFYNKHNFIPEINNNNHAEELIVMAKNIFKEKEEKGEFWVQGLKKEIVDFDDLFEKTIKNLSLWSKVQISPIASFIGGVIAQEIVKYTGKFTPFNQWFWCNFNWVVENLGNNIDRTLRGTRYDDQIAIFGNEIQNKLKNTSIFMIGAGALGCEYLKSFSSMGISTDKMKKNKVTVTDNDNIIKSNLSRQFLFRENNIGEPKSKIACERIQKLNQSFNCVDLQARVGEENGNLFSEDFWKNQNFIISAVDNIEARKYIANKSKIYNKILIDSGTNGTKANSQIIIPYKTADYFYTENINTSEQIQMCTPRNFPSRIEHCIGWARDGFDEYFVKAINGVKAFIEDREIFYQNLPQFGVPSDQMIKLNEIIRYTKMIINKDFKECIKIALEVYNKLYNNSVVHILNKYPSNYLNKDGTKFWSGDKRIPKPLPFNIENELAFLFIEKYAKILANSMSIPLIEDNELLKNEIIQIKSSFIKDEEKSIKSKFNKYEYFREYEKNIEETQNKINSDIIKLNIIKEEANNLNVYDIKQNIKNIFKSQEFEKDEDSNGHVDYIYAASNLRAELFQIEKCSRIRAKIISGKIIPAIATTTSSIVGLASLQLYSLYQSNDIKYLRDNYFNLAICSFTFSTPGIYKKNEEEEKIKTKQIQNGFWNFVNFSKNSLYKLKNILNLS